MPDTKQTGNVTCPRCRTLLTTADRISKSALQALFAPHSKRYHCDSCGLKFKVLPAPAQATAEQAPSYELPPLRADALADASSRKRANTSPERNSYVETRPRRTQLHVTDVPDIPGITHSAEKAALKKMADQNRELQQELKRLRRLEKKYHELKKANHFLAKATTQRRN